jgi:large subunit ribosomal protein L31
MSIRRPVNSAPLSPARGGFIDAATLGAAGSPSRSRFVDRKERVMKADIHPNYHMIKVVMTNGTEFMTRSTYGEEGATLNLDIDPNTHPAWTGGSQQLLDRGGRLSRFNSRFAGIGVATKK